VLVSHEKGFAFFRVPKTGSTTAYRMLAKCGIDWDYDSGPATPPNSDWPHWTPAEAVANGVLTQAQVDSYQLYAFFRNPVERFASMVCHLLPESLPQDFVDFAERFWDNPAPVDVDTGEIKPPKYGPGGTFAKQQTDYEPCAFLSFENLGAEIDFLHDALGVPRQPLEWRNKRGTRNYNPQELFDANPRTRENLMNWWPQDFDWWQRNRNV
jgi:hypothetical protein